MDGWWTGKKRRSIKWSSKTIDIVSSALEVSVNGVTCVVVAHFRSSDSDRHILKFVNWLSSLHLCVHQNV